MPFLRDEPPTPVTLEREFIRTDTVGSPTPLPPPSTSPAAAAVAAVLATKMGAPGGLATLDTNRKIPVDQMQMANETRVKLEEIEEALAGTGATDPGDLTLIFDNQLL